MSCFTSKRVQALLLGTALCAGGGTALLAQNDAPSASKSSPDSSASSVEHPSQTFLERDPATGGFRMFLILPTGEKKLLQTFPPPHLQFANPLIGTDADYLHALSSLPADERYIVGVELKTIPEGLHSRLGIPENCGLIVAHLVEGKPAAKAGMKKHDLLLKINGTPVSQPGDVVRLVNEAKGAELTLTVLRDKKPFELKVVPMEAQPGDFTPPAPVGVVPGNGLPAGVLPPGVQVAGPGMIVPSPRSADIELLHADLTAVQQQVKALRKEVEELQEQLRDK